MAAVESRVLRARLDQTPIVQPVYIAGLARSGSTLLLESLYDSGCFASHRYADFPLVWLPYAWPWLRGRLPLPTPPPVERAHGDGILVTPDSPEALEEPLWMHFFAGRHDPAINQVLDATCDHARFAGVYRDHVRKLLIAQSRPRYLAKGNYNLPRLPLLRHLFPDARFLVPIREPVAQVASLVRQDRRFCEAAQRDAAIGRHLAQVGHFEFGPGRRVASFGDATESAIAESCFREGRTVEGYARQWRMSHGWLLARLRSDAGLGRSVLLVPHEQLCADPATVLARIARHAALSPAASSALVDRWQGRIAARGVFDHDPTATADGELVRSLCADIHAGLLAWSTATAAPTEVVR